MMKEQLLLKIIPNSRLKWKNHTPIQDQNGQINTQFMTRMANVSYSRKMTPSLPKGWTPWYTRNSYLVKGIKDPRKSGWEGVLGQKTLKSEVI